ncbi:Hypothetical protein NGAL_HAMBI2605_33320 [Neorhizobium galegae bv. orientalis]|jgi:hypothetical protein|nr:Hypothetical protein NGAL_HAMBI2605_33320 [Neorhizobium galegae bv. orientalis]
MPYPLRDTGGLKSLDKERGAGGWPISPLVGEMPGRAEGGGQGQDDHHLPSATPANPVICNSLAFSSPSG